MLEDQQLSLNTRIGVEDAVLEALRLLQRLSREKVTPEAALREFQVLRSQFPGMSLELLWEQERITRCYDYDVLLTLPGEGAISLSFCAERGVPWALRGVIPVHEHELLRVNGDLMSVDKAIACLDFIWREAEVARRLIDMCLIGRAVREASVEVSDTAVQRALDAFRAAKGLLTADELHHWLKMHGLSLETLLKHLEGDAAVAVFQEQITASGVDAYFAEHAAEFDVSHVTRFRLPTAEAARDWMASIQSREEPFLAAAQRTFLEGGAPVVPLFASLRRGRLTAAQATLVFNAEAGHVVGPVPSGGGFEVIQVLRIQRAVLDEPTRRAVQDALFERWLAEQRAVAEIEWFWGGERS